MKGVMFGNLHSFDAWGLLLTSKEIGSPEIKEKKVDVEGADGQLDYTEYFGGVKFGNRTLKFDFSKGSVSPIAFLSLVSQIQAGIHGRRLVVALDDDPDWYYQGRIRVSDFTHEKGIAKVSIEVDADPYKLKKAATVVTKEVAENGRITLHNSRKPVVPTITTDAAMTITYAGTSYAVQAGTFRLPELQLKEGDSIVTFKGTGTVVIEYREGSL